MTKERLLKELLKEGDTLRKGDIETSTPVLVISKERMKEVLSILRENMTKDEYIINNNDMVGYSYFSVDDAPIAVNIFLKAPYLEHILFDFDITSLVKIVLYDNDTKKRLIIQTNEYNHGGVGGISWKMD